MISTRRYVINLVNLAFIGLTPGILATVGVSPTNAIVTGLPVAWIVSLFAASLMGVFLLMRAPQFITAYVWSIQGLLARPAEVVGALMMCTFAGVLSTLLGADSDVAALWVASQFASITMMLILAIANVLIRR